MRRPDPTWETEYAHDRRKHRHRCRACNRIIDAGERVVMVRVRRGTLAMHSACADLGDNRAHMTVWGLKGLKARGWRVPELD